MGKGQRVTDILIIKIKLNNMNKITDKIKVLLGIAKQKFASVETDKGVIYFDGEELKVEDKVYTDEGAPVEDGEYEYNDKVYVVKESVVTEIKDKVEEPKEEVTEETKTETTTETTEEVKEELADDETIVEEVKEEVVEEVVDPAEPTIEERVDALEEVVEMLFNELREMKVREVEAIAKNEDIVREFSAMKRSATAESVTKGKDEKCFSDCGNDKADRLRRLREGK